MRASLIKIRKTGSVMEVVGVVINNDMSFDHVEFEGLCGIIK